MCLRVQDMQCVENCDDPNPARRVVYEQPVWQTLQMFRALPLLLFPLLYSYLYPPNLVGEMLCPSFSFISYLCIFTFPVLFLNFRLPSGHLCLA